jgi:hypothetical protein
MRLASACGVLASMPSQQPQVSLPGTVRVIGELGDLQPADRDHAVREQCRIGRGLALELAHRHRIDAFHRLRGGDDAAEVDRLAEREVVGMEHRETAVGQHAAAELDLHRAQHIAAEIARLHAYMQ